MENHFCIAGIDGGGTKSRMLVADDTLRIICDVSAGTTNLCAADEATVEGNLRKLFAQADAYIDPALPLRAVALGTAGVGRAGVADTLARMLHSFCPNVTVTGDMVLPLYAYAPDGNAQIIIAGTGSICYGKNKRGQTARSGGWGHIIGDEGSAYWLGCHALDAVMRAYDGRASDTLLTSLLLAAYHAPTPPALLSVVYAEPFEKDRIARAAVCVAEAADNGDPTASALLQEAAMQLFGLSHAVARVLEAPDAVLLSGGVLVKNRTVRQALHQLIENAYPLAEIVLMDGDTGTAREKDAAWGAVLLAAGMLTNAN